MPATLEKIDSFLSSKEWTTSEKSVILWQFGLLGGFHKALFECIKQADEMNLIRLEYAFPTEVIGFRQWVYGDLGERLRKAGLNI